MDKHVELEIELEIEDRRATMNEHIELVKKWLNDPTSVTKEELNKNARAARTAGDAAYGAAEAARAADSAHTSYTAYAAEAAYWVDQFEEISDE